MKSFILLLVFTLSLFNLTVKTQTYSSLNISLLAHLDPETDNTGQEGRKYSSCWGWYQANKNKEYAIVGTSKQTYFIDVTIPTAPVIVDSVRAKHIGCTWREVKSYQNYCYMVSDQCSPNSFQIVDMQYLPDSVHVVYDDDVLFKTSHTIFVDQDKLYCGSVTESNGTFSTMRVYSLATPSVPVLIRKLEQDVSTAIIDLVHDMFVRNDTIYASCGNKGFHILKLTAANTFSLMQSYTGYAYNGYNHSSWQTDDRKTMVFADEVIANLPAKVIDVSDFNNITLLDTIRSSYTATAHNPYIIGNRWCWMSTYQDGLYLYDISNPSNTTIYGYFDTQPATGLSSYSGNWGAYPFLPSKIIIATDMQNGVFILKGDNAYETSVGIKENQTTGKTSVFSVFPNPSTDQLNCIIANQTDKKLHFIITDILGKIVIEEVWDINRALYKTQINTSHLSDGCYYVTIKGDYILETKKIVIQK